MLEEIDNKKVKVSKFTLSPKDSTGFHVHTFGLCNYSNYRWQIEVN